MTYPYFAAPLPVHPPRRASDPGRTSLIVTLSIAVFALPVVVFLIRLATGSIGWLLVTLALFSPFVFAIGALLPLSALLVPHRIARTVPLWTMWLIAIVHMAALAVLGLAMSDVGDADAQVSPFVAGAQDPERLADTISSIAAATFALTYLAFIALAIAARATRRR